MLTISTLFAHCHIFVLLVFTARPTLEGRRWASCTVLMPAFSGLFHQCNIKNRFLLFTLSLMCILALFPCPPTPHLTTSKTLLTPQSFHFLRLPTCLFFSASAPEIAEISEG